MLAGGSGGKKINVKGVTVKSDCYADDGDIYDIIKDYKIRLYLYH